LEWQKWQILEGNARINGVLAHVTPAIKNKIYKRNLHWDTKSYCYCYSVFLGGGVVRGAYDNDKYE